MSRRRPPGGDPQGEGASKRRPPFTASPPGAPTGLWWNFIGRSHEEIEQARRDWMKDTRFGEVHGYGGGRLPAPELPRVPLTPRGRVR